AFPPRRNTCIPTSVEIGSVVATFPSEALSMRVPSARIDHSGPIPAGAVIDSVRARGSADTCTAAAPHAHGPRRRRPGTRSRKHRFEAIIGHLFTGSEVQYLCAPSTYPCSPDVGKQPDAQRQPA